MLVLSKYNHIFRIKSTDGSKKTFINFGIEQDIGVNKDLIWHGLRLPLL
jgi:hypothetical protein